MWWKVEKRWHLILNPVLLNKQHTFTTLLVQAAHRRVQHNGTLGEIRVKYWIIKGAIGADVTKEGLSSPPPLLLSPFSELTRPHRSPIQLLIMLDPCTLGNRREKRFGFVCSLVALHGRDCRWYVNPYVYSSDSLRDVVFPMPKRPLDSSKHSLAAAKSRTIWPTLELNGSSISREPPGGVEFSRGWWSLPRDAWEKP